MSVNFPSFERILSRAIYITVALLVLALLAGMGLVMFFVLLAVVAIIAMYNILRNSGILGESRDSAFDFKPENCRMDATTRKTVIETEYHVVSQEEEKGS